MLGAARGAVGRPAAAHRAGPRPGQGRRSGPARRAAGQPRLQAARGVARPAARNCSPAPAPRSSMPPANRSRRCCSGATPRPLQRRPRHPVRADPGNLPEAEQPSGEARSSPTRRSTRWHRRSKRGGGSILVIPCNGRCRGHAGLADGPTLVGIRPHHLTAGGSAAPEHAVNVRRHGAGRPRSRLRERRPRRCSGPQLGFPIPWRAFLPGRRYG